MTPVEFKSRLKALGLQQKELAELLGVHPNAVSTWAKGHYPVPGYMSSWLALLERNLELQRRVGELGGG